MNVMMAALLLQDMGDYDDTSASNSLALQKMTSNKQQLEEEQGLETIVLRARLYGGSQKQSGHYCTHSVTTAGMLAEPIRSLCASIL